MFELNILRRRRQRLHICNRSAGRDWCTAVNSIQTWLGQIEGWMLPLFEQRGGGKAKGGIDRISAPPLTTGLVGVGYLQGSGAGGPEQMMFRMWRLLPVRCLLSLTIKMWSATALTGLNSIALSRGLFFCRPLLPHPASDLIKDGSED